MTLHVPSTPFALATLLLAASATGSEPAGDWVAFSAGQRIQGTLTLNYSETGRDARMTPIFSKYRPRLVFNGQEVICKIQLAGGIRSIAPGESAEVHLECKDPVSVARASARATVREGGKNVGHVDVRLNPPAE